MSPATRPREPPDAAAVPGQATGTHRTTDRHLESKAAWSRRVYFLQT